MKKSRFLLIVLLSFIAFDAVSASRLRVMSFNIRQDNPKDGPLNLWQDRRAPLCKYINKVKPDIVGMQEVFKNQLDDAADRMPKYAYVAGGRDDGKDKGEATPIFYRTDKFNLIEKGLFWLSETPDVPSVSWNAKYPGIAAWVILEEKKTGKRFFYCNSHFDHKSDAAKNESAKFIKAQFKKLCKGYPIVFTADCNTYEPKDTYFTLCSYSYSFIDTWKAAVKTKGGPSTSHAYGKHENTLENKIDFIFVTPEMKTKRSVIDDSSLGKGRYTSDHHPIWADLIW
jgi:endonuclease/exonuclease/phosphatase family metal-dependent hydrolase